MGGNYIIISFKCTNNCFQTIFCIAFQNKFLEKLFYIGSQKEVNILSKWNI